jgi:hypothetical protein
VINGFIDNNASGSGEIASSAEEVSMVILIVGFDVERIV